MHGCVLTDPSGNLNLPFPGQQGYLSFNRNMQFGQHWVSLNNIVLLFIQIFLHFWLAEIPRIINHNQILSIKFGRILGYVKNDALVLKWKILCLKNLFYSNSVWSRACHCRIATGLRKDVPFKYLFSVISVHFKLCFKRKRNKEM